MESRHLLRVVCWYYFICLLTVGGYCTQNSSNATSVTIVSSSTITPSLTSSPSMIVSSTSPPVASSSQQPKPPKPTPTPTPGLDFLSFMDRNLYLKIHDINITFESKQYHSLTGKDINAMGLFNNTVNVSKDSTSIVYKRFYGSESPKFYIAFYFKLNQAEDNPTWYISNFQHREIGNGTRLFQYKGTQLSIWATTDLAYHCNSVELVGSGGVEDIINSKVNFTNLQVQPFLNNQDPSHDFFDCGQHSPNNQVIGLVIGLSIGIAILLAAIVVIAAIIVSKKVKNRGYDLLKD